jgi:N-acetylglutamate synthase
MTPAGNGGAFSFARYAGFRATMRGMTTAATTDDLGWRIEETCLRAWPALQERRTGDWLLRFADGFTRRSNSANPRAARIADLAASIAACEQQYRAAGRPPLFRIATLVDPAVETQLDRLGYRAEGETLTLHGPFRPGRRDAAVEILASPDDDWLAAMSALQNRAARDAAIYARLVRAVAIPAGFARLRAGGETIALAYAALHDGLLCFESVITAPAERGRGHARRALESLIAWGESQGAREMCLQVEAHNAPAQRLYRGLGIDREIYRYHYRRAPA